MATIKVYDGSTWVELLKSDDISSWAKSSTKPSYTFGEIGAGIATIGDGANRLMFRTNSSWYSGMYYHTTGAEAMVFMNKAKNTSTGYSTSWIFAYGDVSNRPDWTGLTPAVQIKEGSLIINKLLNGTTPAAYNLDVNGTANITTIYENGTALSSKYLGISAAAASAAKLNTNAGSATNPVYFSGGVPVACTYSLNKTVPSDAVFTDTTYSNATTSAAGLMS